MSRSNPEASAPLSPAGVSETPSAEDLADRIKRRIMRGAYAPGQRLVEADFTQEFKAGRGKIREVFKTLVGEGFLEQRENSGVRVRRLTREEALEIGKVREVLEGLAVRQTVDNGLSPEDRAELAALQGKLDDALKNLDQEGYNRHSAAFHEFFVERARNGCLAGLVERLRIPLFRLQFHTAMSRDSMLERHACAQRITAAVLAGEAAQAEAEMRLYIDGGNKRLSQTADEMFG